MPSHTAASQASAGTTSKEKESKGLGRAASQVGALFALSPPRRARGARPSSLASLGALCPAFPVVGRGESRLCFHFQGCRQVKSPPSATSVKESSRLPRRAAGPPDRVQPGGGSAAGKQGQSSQARTQRAPLQNEFLRVVHWRYFYYQCIASKAFPGWKEQEFETASSSLQTWLWTRQARQNLEPSVPRLSWTPAAFPPPATLHVRSRAPHWGPRVAETHRGCFSNQTFVAL